MNALLAIAIKWECESCGHPHLVGVMEADKVATLTVAATIHCPVCDRLGEGRTVVSVVEL